MRIGHIAAGFVVALACAAGCGSEDTAPGSETIPGLVAVSGASPWPKSCGGGGGTLSYNAEVEPSIAVDPSNPAHLVGVWQQDRWSNGGSNGLAAAASFDSGHTWTRSFAKFTACSGGAYPRASDPWVTIGPTGAVFQIALGLGTGVNAILVSRSPDGGKSWDAPVELIHDIVSGIADDKETITADPLDARYVYAVWDRLTGAANDPNGTGPAWFARTSDGGDHWEAAKPIYDPGANAQTIGNLIVGLRDGTLVNGMAVITQNSSSNPQAKVTVIRSVDHGDTWSSPIDVATMNFVGAFDAKNGRGLRTGSIVPSFAADPRPGHSAVYAVWEDARFSSQQRDGIVISGSTDGGQIWSLPKLLNGAPTAQAFTPVVHVADDGRVGVSYFDLRNDDPADRNRLLATLWLAVSTDGATWTESMVGQPFDIQGAAQVDGPSYFLGDYQGLTHVGTTFLPFFAAVPGAPSNIFFRTADAPVTTVSALTAARGTAESLLRGARERWRFGTLFK